jgi:hypothetical protein
MGRVNAWHDSAWVVFWVSLVTGLGLLGYSIYVLFALGFHFNDDALAIAYLIGW